MTDLFSNIRRNEVIGLSQLLQSNQYFIFLRVTSPIISTVIVDCFYDFIEKNIENIIELIGVD